MLLALVLVYVVVYGALIARSRGLPFVMDNNETFSTLTHAENLFRFGIERSFGLTDEAYGPNPAAHPFLYTHQGNFPRFPALLLYALGARTAEAQIVVSTFTFGLLGVVFLFAFLRRLASAGFAFVYGAVLLTDYVLFAQWQVNTFRVWHLFFFFSSLLCARALTRPHARWWIPVTAANFLAMFYFEYEFAAFVLTMTALFTTVLLWRRWPAIAAALLPQVLGAVGSAALMAIQLIGYYGVSGLVRDFSTTFTTRNSALSDPNIRQRITDLVNTYNIVFWLNLVDSAASRTPQRLIGSVFRYQLQVFGPWFSAILVILSATIALTLIRNEMSGRRHVTSASTAFRRLEARWPFSRTLLHDLAFAFVVLSGYVLGVALVDGLMFAGALPPTPGITAALSVSGGRWWLNPLLLAAAGAVARIVDLRIRSSGGSSALWTLGAFWSVIALYLRYQSRLYAQEQEVIWMDRITPGVWLARPALVAAIALATWMLVRGPSAFAWPRFFRPLLGFFACGWLAYSIVFWLSPGYLLSGYLVRFVPYTVFLSDALVAFVIYAMGFAGFSWVTHRGEPANGLVDRRAGSDRRVTRVAVRAASGALALLLVGVWARNQVVYLREFPPDQYTFLQQLAAPPFRGASFVSNSYSAPVSAYTGQWSYIDEQIGSGKVQLTSDGWVVDRNLDSYLWLADKRTNQAYRFPEYYLCITLPTFDSVTVLRKFPAQYESCMVQPLVRNTVNQTDGPLQNQLVARDTTGRDAWAIIKLDWDYPPFLRPLAGAEGLYVRPRVEGGGSQRRAIVEYQFAQQLGKPEVGTIVRLYSVRDDGARQLLREESGGVPIAVPAEFSGTAVVSVQPRTDTKSGEPYFSAPFTVAPS
ncbi:MAG: hypothetical protein HYX52_07015 [Chloroflexi bacterium]|nr:hypothetical protein [Chloroflexota bacterium]